MPLNLEICGAEEVTVDTADQYTLSEVYVENDGTTIIQSSVIEAWFSTTNSLCGLSYFIDKSSTGTLDLASAEWNEYIEMNATTGDIYINHTGAKAFIQDKADTTLIIFARAKSDGNKEAFKEIFINFTLANPAPVFASSTFKDVIVEVDAGNMTETSFFYLSPEATDN